MAGNIRVRGGGLGWGLPPSDFGLECKKGKREKWGGKGKREKRAKKGKIGRKRGKWSEKGKKIGQKRENFGEKRENEAKNGKN